MRKEPFWLVWCCGGGKPTFAHETYEDALAEADRLAAINSDNVFYVLRTVARVTIERPAPTITRIGPVREE